MIVPLIGAALAGDSELVGLGLVEQAEFAGVPLEHVTFRRD
jgi:hypothetical protein